MAGPYDNSSFNFLSNCHTASYSSCTISHSHRQCTGFGFLHILTNTIFCFLIVVILMPVRSYIFIFMSLLPTTFTYYYVNSVRARTSLIAALPAPSPHSLACGKEGKMLVAQLCPMDCSLPGSSVHEILQARILEWVAIAFCRGSS